MAKTTSTDKSEGVDTRHEDYLKTVPAWKRCSDAYDGEDKIKEEGQTYLPMLGGQSDADYAAYLARPNFYNATARTVEGIMGAVFRKSITVESLPAPIEAHVNATDSTIDLEETARQILREVLKKGRCGALVDVPRGLGNEGLPNQEVLPSPIPLPLPYFVVYNAEQIINWEFRAGGGKRSLTMVVLMDNYKERNPENDFNVVAKERRRVLRLDSSGRYVIDLWVKENDDDLNSGWSIEETMVPLVRDEPLDFIPFMFFGCESNPMIFLSILRAIMSSNPINAPPQMKRISFVSIGMSFCSGCLRPPSGGTCATVPSRIFRSAC